MISYSAGFHCIFFCCQPNFSNNFFGTLLRPSTMFGLMMIGLISYIKTITGNCVIDNTSNSESDSDSVPSVCSLDCSRTFDVHSNNNSMKKKETMAVKKLKLQNFNTPLRTAFECRKKASEKCFLVEKMLRRSFNWRCRKIEIFVSLLKLLLLLSPVTSLAQGQVRFITLCVADWKGCLQIYFSQEAQTVARLSNADPKGPEGINKIAAFLQLGYEGMLGMLLKVLLLLQLLPLVIFLLGATRKNWQENSLFFVCGGFQFFFFLEVRKYCTQTYFWSLL